MKCKNVYKEPLGLVSGNIWSKPILTMTNQDILQELAAILGYPVVPPQEKIGWITDNASDYVSGEVVDAEKLSALYDHGELVVPYIATLALTSLRNRAPDLFTLLDEQVPGNVVLEYGCGTATHGIACAQKGCAVHVMDVSSAMLNLAEERFARRSLTCVRHMKDETLPEGAFDTILCTDVLEHVPDPDAVLHTFLRVLKSGGMLHLHVSPTINLVKGHLPQAISAWQQSGLPFMRKHFKKVSKYNWRKK